MNSVSINLRTDEVVIKIDDNAEQEDVIEELDKKMKDLKKMYQDEKTPIRVTGKILTNKELEEIREILSDNMLYNLTCTRQCQAVTYLDLLAVIEQKLKTEN